jgi:hypothetical protein
MTKELRFLDRRNRGSSQFSQSDKLGIFATATFGLHLLTLVFLFLQYGATSRIARQKPPSLVQLETGQAIAVAPLGNKERTPQVISTFVVQTLTLMMNWSGKLPPQTVKEASNPKVDEGVPIKLDRGTKKVTTSAWTSSFALSEDFRPNFLHKIASLTPQSVFSGKTKVILVPLEVGVPEKLAEGKWKVKLIANLVTLSEGDNVGKTIPFNKEVFVQAVEAPPPPPSATDLVKAVYQVRQSGLEIYGIRDLSREDL